MLKYLIPILASGVFCILLFAVIIAYGSKLIFPGLGANDVINVLLYGTNIVNYMGCFFAKKYTQKKKGYSALSHLEKKVMSRSLNLYFFLIAFVTLSFKYYR